MATTFSLVIQQGPNPGLRTPVAGGTFTIGRDPSCDLHIQDVEVSRRHARLIAQSGGHALEDLGSTNGTFVNGERIRTITVLRPGATIRLGELVTLRYELDLAGLETTPPSPRSAPPRPAQAPPPTASLNPLPEPLPQEPFPADPVAAGRPAAPQGPAHERVPAAPVVPPAVVPEQAAALPQAVYESEYEPAERGPRPVRRHPRRRGPRLPIFSRNWMIGCAVIGLLTLCAGTAFFWYVDANFLWCDVFGGVIAACR